jgi:WD40 repeat protein
VPLPEGSPGIVWEFERQIGDAHRSDSQLTHRVNALAFSPDGKLLATGAGDPSRSGELKLWDPASGTLVCEIPKAHKDAVLSLDFSRDGKLLASGAADRAVRLWEIPSGKLFRNLEAHASHVLSVSLRDDSRRVLSAGADNAVKSWDILRSDVVATFSSFSKEVGFARYLGRGDEFLAASAAPVLRVLRDSGGEVRSTTEGLPKFITATALSADGKLQFIGDASGTVRVLNPEGKVIVAWSHADH